MEIIVVDFSGFYFKDQTIIKEFAVARISGTLIQVEDQILIDTTALPITPDQLYNSVNFRKFYEKCNIDWNKKSNYTRENLLLKLNSLHTKNSPIHLRNRSFATFLGHYMNVDINSFKTLENLGFDDSESLRETHCSNHIDKESYCVKNNVMHMAEWLKEKLKDPAPTKLRLAVINFIVVKYRNHRENINEYAIQAMRVHCFDSNGTTIANKLLAADTYQNVSLTADEMNNYQRDYQNRHGVRFYSTDVISTAMRSQLKRILLDNKIEFIFVESSADKSDLIQLLDPSFKIFPLEDYGFQGDEYTVPNPDNNVTKMIHWVLETKLYAKIKQQLEVIDISDDDD